MHIHTDSHTRGVCVCVLVSYVLWEKNKKWSKGSDPEVSLLFLLKKKGKITARCFQNCRTNLSSVQFFTSIWKDIGFIGLFIDYSH